MINTVPSFHFSETQVTPRLNDQTTENKQSCLVRIYPAGVSGSLIPLTHRRLTIGRDQTCDLEVNDDFMSRMHAVLELTEGGYLLSDCNSRNGTIVNDKQITSLILRPGDQIRLGNHIFKFLSSDHVEAHYHEAVYEMMTLDAMTNLYNRRYFEDAFRREVLRSQRHSRQLSLLIFDIDRFKQINDKYGHLVGDEVLKALSARVRGRVRGDEIVARIGGEEFAVVLVETSKMNARLVAESLCELVRSSPLLPDRPDLITTISVGGVHTNGLELLSEQDLISQADQQLYLAKTSGRDCVRFD
ncbi:MAG: diguanylate cyclase [Planctomycetota bacterium]|jgi:two-component system cell cycle response regulator|nr:MAG: diguanylate cyclase [Planctomycetota bacterium]